MASLHEAIALLERGEWQAAHPIVQEDESPLGCWAHGIVHVMEGDLANADYWYRRAGRSRPEAAAIRDEVAALKSQAGRQR